MAIVVSRTAPLAAPVNAAAVTGTAAGDLTDAKTYYYRITAVTSLAWGRIGIPCAEISAVADANGSINLSWDTVTGALGYLIWRTPVSDDYSFAHPGMSTNMDHDDDCMFLRNGLLYHTNKYTTAGVTFVDLGTSSERPSGYSYYRSWMNLKFRTWGIGSIVISGGIEGSEASWSDIYNEDQSNGWGAFLQLYNNNGFAVWECRDDLVVNNWFKDHSFIVFLYGKIDFQTSADDKTFGFRDTASGKITGDSMFIDVSAGGRQNYHQKVIRGCKFYGVKWIRDCEEVNDDMYSNPTVLNNLYVPSSTDYVYDSNVFYDHKHMTQCQQFYLSTGSAGNIYDRVDIYHNTRGFYTSVDQTGTVINDLRLYNNTMDLGGIPGNTTITILNPTLLKNNSNTPRFYGASVQNAVAILINPILVAGNGFPSMASQGGGAYDCSVYLKWTFDLTVLDQNKNVIADAKVRIEDVQGNIIQITTDVDGVITQQTLTQARYYRSTQTDGGFDSTEDYNPYILTVEKQGYKTYKIKFDLEDKTDWFVRLNHSPYKSSDFN